jgi:hypothetical protein
MPELYDLQSDPKEMRNLALRPEYRSRVDELKAKLFSWYKPPNLSGTPATSDTSKTEPRP